ncbi:MAG: BufA2 family periplasmic bufferin-type metallophore [Burkholderiales bacterium]
MNRRLVSVAIATAAAALFAAGAVGTASGQDVKVKCYGSNSCKGHSDCKTSMSSCKGKNACKGKGFEMMEEKACIEKVGRA